MRYLLFILSLLIVLNGCGSSSSSDTPQKVTHISVPNVEAGSVITLKLNNADDLVSYEWWSQNGTSLGNTPTVEWVAPEEAGEYTITVDTVDINGEKSSSNIDITVTQKVSTEDYPVITLNGDTNITLSLDANYIEYGATAKDAEDGDLEVTDITSNVDTSKVGNYVVSYRVTDSDGNIATKDRYVTVVESQFSGEFAEIKQLLQDSKDGLVSNVTYICVGDSTRAVSDVTHAEHLFDNVSSKLDEYNVNSILKARGSHQLKQFLDESAYPTISDVIAEIPGDGSTTILDMSLGYNDFPYGESPMPSDEDIISMLKDRLSDAIDGILNEKPNTHIYLTSPNPNFSWERPTADLQTAYHEVANEKGLPFVDFVNNIMDGYINYYESDFKNWYIKIGDGDSISDYDQVHFSTYGLDQVSSYILSQILP